MNCFHHHDRASVGTCKSCGKGLCPECIVDLGRGLACRGRCEAEVQALIALIDSNLRLSETNKQVIDSTRKTKANTFAFNLILGFAFIAFGLKDEDKFGLTTILGVCFLAFGVNGFLQAQREQ